MTSPGREPFENPEADELCAAFMGVAPGELVTFERKLPGGNSKAFRVRIQLLNTEQQHAAILAAQKYAKARGEKPGDHSDLYKEAQMVETLFRCMRRPDLKERTDGTEWYPPFFASADQLRQALHPGETAILLNLVELVKAKYSQLENLDEDKLEELVARLSDPMEGVYFLALLDFEQLPGLTVQLARMVRDLYPRCGLSLPSLPSSSESDQESLGSGTTSPSGPRSVRSEESPDLTGDVPTDRVYTREEAARIVREAHSKPSHQK